MPGIRDFFNSCAVSLPRQRPNPDFVPFVSSMMNGYLNEIGSLDPGCHLCQRIQARRADIEEIQRWVLGAIRHYFEGHPPLAYAQIEHALNHIDQNLKTLFTLPVPNDAIAPLYRMVKNGAAAVDKGWLFHCPFDLRHKVGQHRYGIPGFPCLYLGGSIQVCQIESRVPDAYLAAAAVGEFEIRSPVKLLNFAYRPSSLADIAGGSALRAQGANPDLEQFLIDYAICWPLIAAASIQTLRDGSPFVYEYVIPQMILQWIMRSTDCDGIRYFSTRWVPSPDAVKATANYVFPAKPPANRHHRSQPLVNKFSFTDVLHWRSTTAGVDFAQERRDNEALLLNMPKTPLP